MYLSCASSTCHLPSRVRARRAKMSRISCVRSTTLRSTRSSMCRSCAGVSSLSKMTRSAANARALERELVELAAADERRGIGRRPLLDHLHDDRRAGGFGKPARARRSSAPHPVFSIAEGPDRRAQRVRAARRRACRRFGGQAEKMPFISKILARAPTESRRLERALERLRSRRRWSMEAPPASGPESISTSMPLPNDATTLLGRRRWRITGDIGARGRDRVAGTARQRARHGICGHANRHFPRRKMHVVAQMGRRGNDQRERTGPSARRQPRGQRRHAFRRDR